MIEDPRGLSSNFSVLLANFGRSKTELVEVEVFNASLPRTVRIGRHFLHGHESLTNESVFRLFEILNVSKPDFVYLSGRVAHDPVIRQIINEAWNVPVLVSNDRNAIVLGGLLPRPAPSDLDGVWIEPRSSVSMTIHGFGNAGIIFEVSAITQLRIARFDIRNSLAVEFGNEPYLFGFTNFSRTIFGNLEELIQAHHPTVIYLELHLDYDRTRCLPDLVAAFADFTIAVEQDIEGNVTTANRMEWHPLTIVNKLFDAIYQPETNGTAILARAMRATVNERRQSMTAPADLEAIVSKIVQQLKFEPEFWFVTTEHERTALLRALSQLYLTSEGAGLRFAELVEQNTELFQRRSGVLEQPSA
jgi:hypothetical protein